MDPVYMEVESDSRRDIVRVMDCTGNVLLLQVWRWSQIQGETLSGSWIAQVLYCSCRYGCGVRLRRDIVCIMDCTGNVWLLYIWRWSQIQGETLAGS
jgi:hypothetical protein